MSDVVTVPVTLEYNEGEPLGVEGTVVGIINSRPASRRITVLVEKEATGSGDGDGAEAPERVTIEEESYANLSEMGYRELQQFAKDEGIADDIKLNQSTEDLRAAIEETL